MWLHRHSWQREAITYAEPWDLREVFEKISGPQAAELIERAHNGITTVLYRCTWDGWIEWMALH